MPVVTLDHLTVQYGKFTALRDFSASVPEGCVGLLGPNGAGKTTLLKTLLGFIKPTSGSGNVLGMQVGVAGPEIRAAVGYMPEQDCHIPGMNAVQFVTYAGELAGLPHNHSLRRAHEVLEYVGLGEARYRQIETYSTGMKQRIKLAQALVHGPQLLLLDEPTNGLDPKGRQEMLALVRDVSANKGVNVLVCSHLLPDIERTCDSVVVIAQGQMRLQGNVATLKGLNVTSIDAELRETSGAFIQKAVELGFELVHAKGAEYRLSAVGSQEELSAKVFAAANAVGAQVRGLKPGQKSLEDAFMEAIDG
ncbi:MAG: ABC transporter ATP-binding protein [Fimbriimonadaceae bacterium]|nr:MAG: ABC transporter ATP-binding protein [Fimbriimonadaceae bacterium]